MNLIGKALQAVVKADGYGGKLVSRRMQVSMPTLEGTVTITRNNAPHPGATLYFRLDGKAAAIDPSLINAQWYYAFSASQQNWVALSKEKSYTLKASDVGKFFRLDITADGYAGRLQGESIQRRKDKCKQQVVAPQLSVSTACNQVQVTNPQATQEHIIFDYKKTANNLTESDWASAKSISEGNNFLFIGGTASITAKAGRFTADCTLRVSGEKYNIYLAGNQVTTNNMGDLTPEVEEANNAAGRRKAADNDQMEIRFGGEVLWLKNAAIDTGSSGIPGIVINKRCIDIDFTDAPDVICLTPALSKSEGVWYTIDGRKLSSKPSKAGLYIFGNRKVVIK